MTPLPNPVPTTQANDQDFDVIAGIGRAIVEALVAQGRQVLLVCRSRASGLATQFDIVTSQGPNSDDEQIEVLGDCDFGSVASSKAACARIVDACAGKRLGALIVNAGVWPTQRELSLSESEPGKSGLERSFVVNCVAPYLLVCAMLPRLWECAGSRVVVVGAGLYVKGRFDLDRTPTGLDFSSIFTYASTKQAQCLVARQLAAASGPVDLNVVHPGVIRTSLGTPTNPCLGACLGCVKRFWKSPAYAGDVVAYIATEPSLAGKSGNFFAEKKLDKRYNWHKKASYMDLAARLAAYCATLTSVSIPAGP